MPAPATLRIGTRGSPLAKWQAGWVADRLRGAHPGLAEAWFGRGNALYDQQRHDHMQPDKPHANKPHANEAATKDGRIIAGTKTEMFVKATKAPVRIPLSGKTLSFDAGGACVSGCN